ncbi:hypothetical protein B0T19DRAFT_425988 [Cercophora scortea]|uniref:Uncharacterized protein n=1 Tax=Cercophora scortea TaxID=314031 RepID=A0AAE0IE62_9PEZI|nr:hypothetical protein B0T19DRAFT_425988 [Cercophora scortea]
MKVRTTRVAISRFSHVFLFDVFILIAIQVPHSQIASNLFSPVFQGGKVQNTIRQSGQVRAFCLSSEHMSNSPRSKTHTDKRPARPACRTLRMFFVRILPRPTL